MWRVALAVGWASFVVARFGGWGGMVWVGLLWFLLAVVWFLWR